MKQMQMLVPALRIHREVKFNTVLEVSLILLFNQPQQGQKNGTM
jgi:hypothetical protein